MKNTVLPVICILLAVIIVAAMPTEADAAVYTDTVRLHILAPSDSAEDQALKLEVRDAVLAHFGKELGGTRAEALAVLEDRLDEIEALAAQIAEQHGYSAKAELCEEWYDTREYRDFTLPCGTYASLKITLGEGEGQNWWCVMYPPLCLDIATEDVNAEQVADSLFVSPSGYGVRFKLLEVASMLIDG